MNQLQLLNPKDIIILENRERKDMGDIENLAASIYENGQQVPIIITPEHILLDGERRLRACLYLQEKLSVWKIECKISMQDVASDDRKKIIEIITNQHRKQFSWEEDARATEKLKQILRKTDPEISSNNIAKELGLSAGKVSQDLNLVKALDTNPELFNSCKDKKSAIRIMKQHRLDELQTELAKRISSTDYGYKADQLVLCGRDIDLIKEVKPKSIYAIIADPMYGVDMQERSKQIGVDKYDDTTVNFRSNMVEFASVATNVLMDDSVICMFTAMDNIEFLNTLWSSHGFRMDAVPMIWYKVGSHVTRDAVHYFGKSYEFIVYGTRGEASLVKGTSSNVLSYPAIASTVRDHPYEKPIELMDDIVSRFLLPGQSLLDFQCGSGSTLISGIKKGCKVLGFELDPINHSKTLIRVSNALKAKDAGLIDSFKD